MRVIFIPLLFIAQLALYTHSLPTPSTLSIRQEGISSLPYDYKLHRRAGHLAKEVTPELQSDQVYAKDAHQQLASANANNAGKEFKGAFTGAGRSVTYGASQGYLHSKAAYQSFRSGQFGQGFAHTGKAIVKPIAGVGMSAIPLYQGLRYGTKSSMAALSQKYKQYRAPKYQVSNIGANDLRNQVWMKKNQTPGKDYSHATIQENLRFKTQNYANGGPKVMPVGGSTFAPNAQQQRNQDLPWTATSGNRQYGTTQSELLQSGSTTTNYGQPQHQRGKDLPWTAAIGQQKYDSQLQ